MLCLPALRVAAAKVLEETVAAAVEIEIGEFAVVAAEARLSKFICIERGATVQRQQRSYLSPVPAIDEMLSLRSAQPPAQRPAQRAHCGDNVEPESQ